MMLAYIAEREQYRLKSIKTIVSVKFELKSGKHLTRSLGHTLSLQSLSKTSIDDERKNKVKNRGVLKDDASHRKNLALLRATRTADA